MKLGKHISHGFYMVSDSEAARMAREVGAKLPRYGYELRLDRGALMRTPYRYHSDAPKRGWVWAVLADDDWIVEQSRAARRNPSRWPATLVIKLRRGNAPWRVRGTYDENVRDSTRNFYVSGKPFAHEHTSGDWALVEVPAGARTNIVDAHLEERGSHGG